MLRLANNIWQHQLSEGNPFYEPSINHIAEYASGHAQLQVACYSPQNLQQENGIALYITSNCVPSRQGKERYQSSIITHHRRAAFRKPLAGRSSLRWRYRNLAPSSCPERSSEMVDLTSMREAVLCVDGNRVPLVFLLGLLRASTINEGHVRPDYVEFRRKGT
jgi:hypothetical protein